MKGIAGNLGLPCDTPDELSSVAQHRRQNSQSGRKGADQHKMTDPAISTFLGNTAMGVNLLGALKPSALKITDHSMIQLARNKP